MVQLQHLISCYKTVSTYFTCKLITIPLENSYISMKEKGKLFQRFIDDVRIYDRALSAEEVQALYNLGSNREQAHARR